MMAMQNIQNIINASIRVVFIGIGAVMITTGCSTEKNLTDVGPTKKGAVKQNKAQNEQNFNYLFSEAVKQSVRGNVELALKYFQGCLTIKPQDDAVNYELSRIYAYAGRTNEAKKFGWKAIEIDPENKWYYYQLAGLYESENNYDTLALIYGKMIRYYPDNTRIKMALERVYKLSGRFNEAMRILEELKKKYGYSKEIGFETEDILERKKQWNKAIDECNKMLKLWPDDIRIKGIKAEIYSKTGKFARADSIYAQMVPANESNLNVKMSLLEHLIRKEGLDSLGILYNEILNDNRQSLENKYNYFIGLIELAGGKPIVVDTLEKRMVKWLIDTDADFQFKANIADFLIRKEHYRHITPLLINITEERPEIAAAWQQLGIILERNKEPEEMISEMKRALKYHKKDPVIYLLLGSGLMQKGETQKAIEYLEKGLKFIDKKSNKSMIVQYYGMLGDAYNELKEYDKSTNYYEMALKLDPENLIILNNYSYYLSVRGERLKEAKTMSKKTLEKDPENPTYLDTYGWILYKMGKTKEAEKFIRKALEKDQNQSAEILEHYGDILMKQGKINDAVKYWKYASKLDPENKRVKRKIDEVSDK